MPSIRSLLVLLSLAFLLAPAVFAADTPPPAAGAPAPAEGARPPMDRMGGGMPAIEDEFKALDADGNGQLTIREYARSVFVRREFMAADKDRDGKITKDEYVSFRPAGMFQLAGRQGPQGGERGTGDPDAMFARIDRDKNGEITEAEAENAWRWFGRSDANSDGKVTKEEFAKAREAREKANQERRAEEFGGLDKNSDASLSFVELLARPAGMGGMGGMGGGMGAPGATPGAGATEGAPGTPPRAGERLRALDKNGDGKISKDEFPGAEERFKALDTNGDGSIDADEMRAARARGGAGRQN